MSIIKNKEKAKETLKLVLIGIGTAAGVAALCYMGYKVGQYTALNSMNAQDLIGIGLLKSDQETAKRGLSDAEKVVGDAHFKKGMALYEEIKGELVPGEVLVIAKPTERYGKDAAFGVMLDISEPFADGLMDRSIIRLNDPNFVNLAKAE